MHLNHPEAFPATPLPICGKIVFHKTSPWCQQVGGPWSKCTHLGVYPQEKERIGHGFVFFVLV